jgi:hypothetical protein
VITARNLLALVLACAACGDGVHREEMFTAASGSRLALQQLRYDDGTELATADEFYDTELHVRCAPRPWIDDVVRCVPAVDDAVYTDAACTMLAGRARTDADPVLFLAHAAFGDDVRPARLFRAGEAIDPIAEYYELRDGACTGPIPSPEEPITYFAVGDELDGASLVPIRDAEAGHGSLGVRVRESDDGALVPLGLVDRQLGAACTPARGTGGRVLCAPAGAAPASYFRDPACRDPVAALAAEAPDPSIAAVVEPSGCTGYRAVAGEVPTTPLYRRDGAACLATAAPAGARLFAAGAALELAPIERALEDAPGRRLQRIVLEAAGLRFFDDRLFDTATRADCRRLQVADVPRCIPEAVAPARTLFAPGCAIALPVAELPRPTCEPIAFATSSDEDGFEIRALGDRPSGALFQVVGGACLPYPVPDETSLRTLGPPIDPAAFVGAIYFGAR